MIYLLDSNVWATILRSKHPHVASRYSAIDPADIRVCSVVVAELRYGCAKSAKPVFNRATLDALLAPVASLAFDDAAAEHFVSVRRHVESLGQPIGPYDLQIAAIALARDPQYFRGSAGFPASRSKTGRFHERIVRGLVTPLRAKNCRLFIFSSFSSEIRIDTANRVA